MQSEEYIEWLKAQDLKNLNDVFEVLANKVWQERQTNKGFIPFEIFNAAIGISGNYTTTIAIPRIINNKGEVLGYAHKLRESEDDGWAGYFHQPGTLIRTTQPDPFGDSLVRLTQEFFGGASQYQGKKITELGFSVEAIPDAFVWEAFRRAFATRIAFFIDIPESVYTTDMVEGSGKEWVMVENPSDTPFKTIPFELAWLQWAILKDRPAYPLILPASDRLV